MQEARSARKIKPTTEAGRRGTAVPAVAQWVRGYGHIEIGDQEGFGFVVRALDYGGLVFEDDSPTRSPRRWRLWRRGWPGGSRSRGSRSNSGPIGDSASKPATCTGQESCLYLSAKFQPAVASSLQPVGHGLLLFGSQPLYHPHPGVIYEVLEYLLKPAPSYAS